jgi:hypothetical protein
MIEFNCLPHFTPVEEGGYITRLLDDRFEDRAGIMGNKGSTAVLVEFRVLLLQGINQFSWTYFVLEKNCLCTAIVTVFSIEEQIWEAV